MKNDLSNTEIAPVTTLPENVRIPLHSLQADLEYLIGRVIADGSCGPMIVTSMRDCLDQIEAALITLREPQASAAGNSDLFKAEPVDAPELDQPALDAIQRIVDWETRSEAMAFSQVSMLMKKASEAPVWYGAEQADAWACGYNSALEEAASPASTSPCLNCGDPSHEPFCGTCREMGCEGEKPSPPVKNDHAAEEQAYAPSLREALRPFAAVAAVDIGSDEADGDMFSSINHHNAPRLTVGDFRRALAALLAPAEPRAAPELTATCTKLLPGWIIDDSTYSQIEDALDAINAPMTGDGGRYLTISERIAALNHSKSDTLKSAAEKALNYIENTENELGIKLSCGDALREALK